METGGRILVVDDNGIFRNLVSTMLARLGYDVSTADSGESGLSIFLKNKFDVVLSDFEMPGMDGVAFARSVKNSSPLTRVVIMTGSDTGTVFSTENPAVDKVISKPFTMEEIGETIRSLRARNSGTGMCSD